MKTKNIRWIMWVLAMAMTTGISAQKTVLKAFDKMKDSKGVIIDKRNNVRSNEPGAWSSEVIEFHITDMKEARKHIARIEEAFIKDSQKENVTYYTRMKALTENSTAAEREAYKKIQVKYDHVSIPITIGIDPSYNAIILRCQSSASNMSRTVVAIEWKTTLGRGYQGRLYEIKGKNESLWEEASFNPFLPSYHAPVIEKRKDDIVTRMHFYRDNFNGEDDSDNSALLLNMTEYLNTNWEKASDSERNMIMVVLNDMHNRSRAEMHKNLIKQCENSLKSVEISKEMIVMWTKVKQRIALYQKDYLSTTSQLQRSEILDNLQSYIVSLKKMEFDGRTVNDVYDELISFKKKITSQLQQNTLNDIISIFLKNSEETTREENAIVMGSNVKQRIALYQKDYLATTSQLQRSEILDNLKSYVVSLKKKNLDGRTINDAYEELILFKKKITSQLQLSTLNDIISILLK